MENRFDTLLLIARPGAGKSEIIDYLKRTPEADRIERFHIGVFNEVDDFPMLWAWFEEDAILQEMGHDRLHSDEDGYFLGHHLWNLLIRRLCLDRNKARRDKPEETVVMEFARGSEHGGFKAAFSHLDPDLLGDLVILYLNVSWEESLRKNLARFNPDRPDSILEHGLSREKLERLYKDSDWDEVSADAKDYLEIKGVKVPFVVFENEDDVTTERGDALGERLEECLHKLWDRHQRR